MLFINRKKLTEQEKREMILHEDLWTVIFRLAWPLRGRELKAEVTV